MTDESQFIELKDKLQLAKKVFKTGNSKKAVKILNEILEIEEEKKDVDAIFTEARNLYIKYQKLVKLKRFQYLIILIFIFTAIALGLLNWIEVSSVAVKLDIAVSALKFQLAKPWKFPTFTAKEITLQGVNDFPLEVTKVEKAIKFDKTDLPSKWKKLPVSNNRIYVKHLDKNWTINLNSEFLKISSFKIDSGSTVVISKDEKRFKEKFRISIQNGSVTGTIFSEKPVIISCNQCLFQNSYNESTDLGEALRIVLDDNLIFGPLNQSMTIVAEFKVTDETEPLFADQDIPINHIEFTREAGVEGIVSTVVEKGTMFLSQRDGIKQEINAGDFLKLEGKRNLQINNIQAKNNKIYLSIQGRFSELKCGTKGFFHSRKPSLLQWLIKNEPIYLYFTTLIPILFVIKNIYSWLNAKNKI